MKLRPLLTLLFLLPLGPALPAATPAAAAKPGYTVVIDIKMNEQGVPEDAKVVQSDDPSGDHVLEWTAMAKAKAMKQEPRIKEGHAVKYTVKAPFFFPVEGDEGPDNGQVSRPKISSAVQPVYPAEQAARGEIGGAILEAVIRADGTVATVKELRSTQPVFAQAALAAVQQWKFVPAQQDGKAVESRWRLSISFETDVSRNDWMWRVAPRPSLGSYTVVHRTLPEAAPAAGEKPAAPPAGK
jgi:TonB family protein